MHLVDLPHIGFAIISGLLLGSLILTAIILRDGSKAGKTTQVPPSDNGGEPVVFLFEQRDLLQMTDAATVILEGSDMADIQADDKAEPDDWARLVSLLGPRFTDLPEDPAALRHVGRKVMKAEEPSDTGRLILEAWDDHIRLTLENPTVCSLAPSGDLEDEAACLRQAVTCAPYPIWQFDQSGHVRWANTAYLDLVARFKSDDAMREPHVVKAIPSLFDIPLQATQDNVAFRVSITPAGAVTPYWFDIRSLKLEGGWMNYATDVNAVVNAEIAQRNFVQTLTKTFAQLSIGLAIFDRKRQLALFNPALIDLTALPAEFLSARPNLLSFFDRLRERRMMPEPKNYRSWRDQITDLVAAADTGQYRETWSLPSGLTYRISGRPHPDGAVAFLFEDISAEISSTRHFRSQLEVGQSVLNTLSQSIAVFSSSGVLAFSNSAYRAMWGIDPDSSFADISVNDASMHWQAGSLPTPVWGDLRDFVVQFGERSDWEAEVTLRDGRAVICRVVPLAGGTTLVTFEPEDTHTPIPLDNNLRSSA
ncbi:MAG: PAS-domain containing protein [Rhodobacterales bacterium]